MKSVYIVSDGEYSDYIVRGIYSSRRLAEQAKKLFMADNDIQEMTLNDIPKHPAGTVLWAVVMDKEGTTYRIERASAIGTILKWEPKSFRRLPVGVDYESVITFEVWAKNERGAVKVANERRAALLANDIWTTDYKTWKQYMDGGVDVFGEDTP